MKLFWIRTRAFKVMLRTRKDIKGQKLCNLSKWSYDSCVLHFLLLCLTIVWNCIELQPVVFKLCSRQGKETKGNNYVISQDGVMVLEYCTSSQFAWPLYEVIRNSNHESSGYAPDKENATDRLTDRPTNQPTNQLTDRPPVDCYISP